jgi:hypothetical protein
MGPWTGRAGANLALPRVGGLKGHSVTLASAGLPAHALFVDYRMADGRRLEPEIFPRPDMLNAPATGRALAELIVMIVEC